MSGKLISVGKRTRRNVNIVVTPKEVSSEIASPRVSYDPQTIEYYEISGLQERDDCLVTLTFVLADARRVQFYSTHSKFDMVLLLDELDTVIGERRRESV